MNESTMLQMLIQAGAIGICALLIVSTGRKLDHLAQSIDKLVERLDNDLERRKWRDE